MSARRFLAVLALASLAPHVARAGDAAATADRGARVVRAGNLVYAGDKQSRCFSDAFLADVFREAKIATERPFAAVHLADLEDLMAHPFVVMNGEDAFDLQPQERDNLRAYLAAGGFLLASAGCSSPPWAESMRNELLQLFGPEAVAPLTLDHPIFHTLHDIDRVPLKGGGDAKFDGVTLDGRLVCLFSPEGLNNTASVAGCCCCGGNEVKIAADVVANALVYSLVE